MRSFEGPADGCLRRFTSILSVVESAALAQEGDSVDEQGSEGDSVGTKKVGHGFLLLDSVE